MRKYKSRSRGSNPAIPSPTTQSGQSLLTLILLWPIKKTPIYFIVFVMILPGLTVLHISLRQSASEAPPKTALVRWGFAFAFPPFSSGPSPSPPVTDRCQRSDFFQPTTHSDGNHSTDKSSEKYMCLVIVCPSNENCYPIWNPSSK